MTYRIDRAVRSAGWIRHMKAYTCVVKNDHLYLIATMDVGRIHNAYNMPKDLPLFPPDLDTVEEGITVDNLESLVQEKYCLKIPLKNIYRAKLTVRSYARLEKGNYGSYDIPILRLRTTEGRLYLEFRAHPVEEVKAFVGAIQKGNATLEVIIKG